MLFCVFSIDIILLLCSTPPITNNIETLKSASACEPTTTREIPVDFGDRLKITTSRLAQPELCGLWKLFDEISSLWTFRFDNKINVSWKFLTSAKFNQFESSTCACGLLVTFTCSLFHTFLVLNTANVCLCLSHYQFVYFMPKNPFHPSVVLRFVHWFDLSHQASCTSHHSRETSGNKWLELKRM